MSHTQQGGGYGPVTTLGNGLGFIGGFIFLNPANSLLSPYFYAGFMSLISGTGNQVLFYYVWLMFLYCALFSVIKFSVFAAVNVIKAIFATLLALITFRRKDP